MTKAPLVPTTKTLAWRTSTLPYHHPKALVGRQRKTQPWRINTPYHHPKAFMAPIPKSRALVLKQRIFAPRPQMRRVFVERRPLR